VTAAEAFLRKALKTQGQAPLSITLDGYAASHRAVREMPAEDMIWKDTNLRSSKYLNNMIEQDHRGVKSRITPMLGFKVFKRAIATIAGIELLQRIRKGQFVLNHLGAQGQAAPTIWTAVLAA
jgi:transposase-like protein